MGSFDSGFLYEYSFDEQLPLRYIHMAAINDHPIDSYLMM